MSRWEELNELATEWARINDKVLKAHLVRLKINDTLTLSNSVNSKVTGANGSLKIDLHFTDYGRYRDMGAGRKKIESTAGNRALITGQAGRKPARWYSKPFYSRLHALQGITSASMQEKVVSAIQSIENNN